MRVVFYLSRYPGDGGIERVTSVIATALHDAGVELTIVSTVSQHGIERPADLHGEIGLWHNEGRGWLRDFLTTWHADVLVYQDSYAGDFSIIKEETEGLPIRRIVVEHNTPDAFLHTLNFISVGQNRLKVWLRRQKIRHDIRKRHRTVYEWADRYVLLSERYRDLFRQITGLHKLDKLRFMPNPLTLPQPTDAKTRGNGARRCLFVGRLNVQKGIGHLVKIWDRLKDGSDCRLTVVGVGEEQALLDSYIADWPDCRMTCEGFQKDMSGFYADSDVLLMTSLFEGWPLVLYEAMAYGCVPVAFDSFLAAREIISDGVDGFLVKPFDVEDYVERVRSLLADETLLCRMRDEAMATAARHSVGCIVEKWKKLFVE